jgi:hypothetical protein
MKVVVSGANPAMNEAPDDSRRRAAARDEEERPMERNMSIIRSDLAFAAGLRNPSLVTAR